MKKAILDRIEDGKAVFLLEPDQTEWQIDKEKLDSSIKKGMSSLFQKLMK